MHSPKYLSNFIMPGQSDRGVRHAHKSQAKDDDAAPAVVGGREWATHVVCVGGEERVERGKNRPKVGERGAQKRTRRKTNERCLPETIEACVEQGLLAFYVTNPCWRSPSPPTPSPLADPTLYPPRTLFLSCRFILAALLLRASHPFVTRIHCT